MRRVLPPYAEKLNFHVLHTLNNPILLHSPPMWCYDPYISITLTCLSVLRPSRALVAFLVAHSLTCEIAGQVKPFPQPLTWLVLLTCSVDITSTLNGLVNTMVTSLIMPWLVLLIVLKTASDCPAGKSSLSNLIHLVVLLTGKYISVSAGMTHSNMMNLLA